MAQSERKGIIAKESEAGIVSGGWQAQRHDSAKGDASWKVCSQKLRGRRSRGPLRLNVLTIEMKGCGDQQPDISVSPMIYPHTLVISAIHF